MSEVLPDTKVPYAKAALEQMADEQFPTVEEPPELEEDVPVEELELIRKVALAVRSGKALSDMPDRRYRKMAVYLFGIIKEMYAEHPNSQIRQFFYEDMQRYSPESLRVTLLGALRYIKQYGNQEMSADKKLKNFVCGCEIRRMKNGLGMCMFFGGNTQPLVARKTTASLADVLNDRVLSSMDRNANAGGNVEVPANMKNELIIFMEESQVGDSKTWGSEVGFTGAEREFVATMLESIPGAFSYEMTNNKLKVFRKRINADENDND